MGLIQNLKKRGTKDITSKAKIIAFLENYIFKKHFNLVFINADSLSGGETLSPEEAMAFCEQVVYRSRLYPCNSCKNERGECKNCGCPLPEKFLSVKGSCEGEAGGEVWGDILPKSEWIISKKIIDLIFH